MSARDPLLVIGAGMAGLMAARALVDAGHEVIVLDKGRGVGGRMATRRVGLARVDHGAQFFTAEDEAFRAAVEAWTDADVAVPWTRGFAGRDGAARVDGRQTYRGRDGMSAIPKYLARGLDVRTGCRVTSLRMSEGGIQAIGEDGSVWNGNGALITAPVPQSLALIADLSVDDAVRAALRMVAYDPCFALLATLDGPSAVPSPGGLKLDEEPLAWIADNTHKGISPAQSSVTIHASATYTRANLESDPQAVQADLLKAAEPWLGSAVVESQLHRWLYAFPTTTWGAPYVVLMDDPPVLLAGDAFGGPRVQGAAVSGAAAAAWLAQLAR